MIKKHFIDSIIGIIIGLLLVNYISDKNYLNLTILIISILALFYRIRNLDIDNLIISLINTIFVLVTTLIYLTIKLKEEYERFF